MMLSVTCSCVAFSVLQPGKNQRGIIVYTVYTVYFYSLSQITVSTVEFTSASSEGPHSVF